MTQVGLKLKCYDDSCSLQCQAKRSKLSFCKWKLVIAEAEGIACLVEGFLACKKFRVHSQHHTDPVWWHRPATVAFGKWRQEGQAFNIITTYIASLRPFKAIQDPDSERT